VTLECSFAINSSSELQVNWTKDGNVLPGDVHPGSGLQLGEGLATYNLEFSSIQYQDRGMYECIAKSDFHKSTIRSSIAELIIFGKPTNQEVALLLLQQRYRQLE